MPNITNSTDLKKEIAMLEVEHAINGQLLKRQFQITLESLTPLKIIENSLRDIVSSPLIGKSIFDTILGMATGFLSKKVAVGKSGNVFRNLFGSFLQLGLPNLIAQHHEAIKNLVRFLFEKTQNKKEQMNEETN